MQATASIDYLRQRAVRLAQRLSPRMQHLSTVRVAVLSGSLKGLSSDLGGIGFRLGGSENSNIILLDDGLEDIEVEVSSRQSAIGGLVNVRANGPGVRVGGTEINSTGLWERLPCNVDIRGCRVSLSRPPQDTRRGGFLRIGAVLLAAVGVILFAPHAPKMSVSQSEPAPIVAPETSGLDLLEEDIKQAGLGNYLTVSPDVGGTFRVSGALPTGQMNVWRDLHMAWDAKQGVGVVIGQVTELTTLDSIPPIAAVRLGADPYILLADHRRLEPGDVLSDGWSISKIAEAGLVLVRNDEKVEVGF
jgi:hypothetical protein